MSAAAPWTNDRLAVSRVQQMTTGSGVTVAVVDTGVDASVPQLAGHVLPGVDVVNGAGSANTDCFGHGTFVAGIIAAAPRAGTGVVGLAPGVTILPIRQANSPSDGTAQGLAKSIRAAVDGGAKVVNISASAFFPSEELRAAVDYATSRDVLLVASASNEAKSGSPTAYPAAYPPVIAVGAVGRDGRRTEFSEVATFLDLVAPGTDIISLSRAGQGHLSDSGTSFATPFVTAAAALVRAYHPKLTAAQVKRRLEVTADHPGTSLPSPQVGWGVVNPYNAVTAILPAETGSSASPGRLDGIAPLPDDTPDNRARDTAAIFATVAGVLGVVVGLAAFLLPRAMRRRWRPASTGAGSGR
jgi:type VII secretion-associated serine protease mycosin